MTCVPALYRYNSTPRVILFLSFLHSLSFNLTLIHSCFPSFALSDPALCSVPSALFSPSFLYQCRATAIRHRFLAATAATRRRPHRTRSLRLDGLREAATRPILRPQKRSHYMQWQHQCGRDKQNTRDGTIWPSPIRTSPSAEQYAAKTAKTAVSRGTVWRLIHVYGACPSRG